jgi:hypothetical protein
MKHAHKLVALVSLASLGLTNCNKREDASPQVVGSTSASAKALVASRATTNGYLESLAITLARIVNANSTAKQVLHGLADQQFDGDYDIAYATLLHASVNGVTFEQLLGNEGFVTDPLSAGLSDAAARRIVVSLPVLSEQAETVSSLPATFIPEGVADADLSAITVYDGAGNTATFTPNLAPIDISTKFARPASSAAIGASPTEFPLIVVSLGERLDDNGNVRTEFTPEYQTAQAQKSQAANRGGGRTEYLRRIQCSDLGEFEPWIRGEPEFRLYAATSYNNSFSTGAPVVVPYKIQDAVLFTGRRRLFSDGYDPNYRLFTWSSSFSDFYTMRWIEEDGGATVSFTLGATFKKPAINIGATINFAKWEDDDNVGEVPVNITDPNWNDYQYGQSNGQSLFMVTLESRQ